MIERVVSFGSGGLTLAGTLALPDGAGPFPRLAVALGERAGAMTRLVVVAGASHNFKRVS